jgi:hypothetical protein
MIFYSAITGFLYWIVTIFEVVAGAHVAQCHEITVKPQRAKKSHYEFYLVYDDYDCLADV